MNIRKLFLVVALLAAFALSSAAAPTHAQTTDPSFGSSIPAAHMLNPDGTLNLQKGVTGSLDLAGWHVSLDPKRGPVFASLAPTANVWSGINYGVNNAVESIAVSGSDVYVGGNFSFSCDNSTCDSGWVMNNIAKWDGTSWSPLGYGVNGEVDAIIVSGDVLWAGGDFQLACGDFGCSTNNTRVNHIAYWNGSAWLALVYGFNARVSALALGNSLYAGGGFTQACGNADCNSGNITVNHVARDVISTWAALDHGLDSSVYALAFNNGNLYVGGYFTKTCTTDACSSGTVTNRVAKWDGSSWSALGNGVDNPAYALALIGTDLYVGGAFYDLCGNSTCNSGNVPVNFITKWNGSQWIALGNGVDSPVHALAVSGTDLYVGGEFTQTCGNSTCNSGNIMVNYVAKWDGSQWFALSNGVDGIVDALALSGSDLYVGGTFTHTCGNSTCNYGNVTVNRVAKYGACDAKPAAATLLVPANKEQLTKQKIALDWNDVTCTDKYKVRVKQDSKQGDIAFKTSVTVSQVTTTALAKGHTYYWFVKACNSFGCQKSGWRHFSINP